MKIGEFGQQAGVSSKIIRYDESIGLLDEPIRKTRAGPQELVNWARDLDPTTCTDRNRCQVISTVDDAIAVSTDSP